MAEPEGSGIIESYLRVVDPDLANAIRRKLGTLPRSVLQERLFAGFSPKGKHIAGKPKPSVSEWRLGMAIRPDFTAGVLLRPLAPQETAAKERMARELSRRERYHLAESSMFIAQKEALEILPTEPGKIRKRLRQLVDKLVLDAAFGPDRRKGKAKPKPEPHSLRWRECDPPPAKPSIKDPALGAIELRLTLAASLKLMSTQDAELTLELMHGASIPEAAEKLGMSRGAVDTALSRLRKKIRLRL